MKQVKRMLLR